MRRCGGISSYGEFVERAGREQGQAEGQSNLGILYDLGQGVKQDYVEAAKWYRKAAEQGLQTLSIS